VGETEVDIGVFKNAEEGPHHHLLNARKLLVVFNSALGEELQVYSHVYELRMSNQGLRGMYSNASSGFTVRYFGDDGRGLLKEVVKPI
jgi:hypothetical protein